MFHIFFISLTFLWHFVLFLFSLYLLGQQNSLVINFFSSCQSKPDRIFRSGFDNLFCISKSQIILWVSFSKADLDNLLHSSHWITYPTQSYLPLYSFCTDLVHKVIMCLTISFLCIPSWPDVFWYGTFLDVTLGECRCMFAPGSSSIPCHSYLSIRPFYSHILLQNCFVFFVSGYSFVLLHSPPFCW